MQYWFSLSLFLVSFFVNSFVSELYAVDRHRILSTIGSNQELLLQIEEVGPDWSDEQVRSFVDEICNTVQKLRKKYKVSVLQNPIFFYQQKGYGEENPSVGVNRIHPNLLLEFRYFADKGIDVYLDIYASDNYTAQNGERGKLPVPSRRYGSKETVKGLGMDLDCYADLFDKYPNVKGVRFHELIGTHDRREDGHGFAVDFSLLPEIAQMIQDHNRRLIWGDQSWDLCYTDPKGHGFWLGYLDEVCDILGDNLTINFNNNGWGAEIQALTFSRNMADYRNGNKWGISDQAWWWQEVEAQSLPQWPNGGVRWVGWGPKDMAPELLAAFTLEAFQRGASLVQIEPPAFLFESIPQIKTVNNNSRRKPYGPTWAFKIFEDLLLRDTFPPAVVPSMNPADYYLLDRARLLNNRWSERSKKYDRITITSIGRKIIDNHLYSSDYSSWVQQEERFSFDWIYRGTIIDALRIRLEFHAIDERMLIKKVKGKPVVEFYDHAGTQYVNCDNLAAPTEEGEMVGITALNLKRNQVGQADPDEIVTARSNGSEVTFTVYEKIGLTDPVGYENFKYEKEDSLTLIVSRLCSVPADKFMFMTGMRTKYVLYEDNTRSLDNLVIALDDKHAVKIFGMFQTGDANPVCLEKTVDLLPETLLDMKANDCTGDYVDELIFLNREDVVEIYSCDISKNNVFNHLSSLENVGTGSYKILPLRWTTYYKDE